MRDWSTMTKNAKMLEALLVKYHQNPTDEVGAVVWKALAHIAASRVRRYLRWEDPEVIGNAVSKAMENIGELDPAKAPALVWFITIVDNECKMALRQKHQRQEVDIAGLPEGAFAVEVDWSTLQDVAAALRPAEQELLKLKLQGLTEAEIAKALGVGKPTAKARLLALVRSLRRRLE
jgi:RNA polymerase sigma factor (sigma-70 family)